MSGRGGRGGGRGGRGGARGGRKAAPPGAPWDIDASVVISDTPQETYPKSYNPPPASNLPYSQAESRGVKYFVKFRRDFHNSPLYTHKHLTPDCSKASSNISDPVAKSYGLQQMNARFGVRSRATIDPFLAVPMYSHKFVDEARIVPEVKGRIFNLDLFPEELWSTLEGKADKVTTQKGTKRKSTLGDGIFDEDDEPIRRKRPETEEERKRRIEEAAQGRDHDDDAAEEEAEDDEAEISQEDDDFEDDEDGGDYNAEQYFENGDEGADFEDEGGGESAMDF
jgi:DNA-directed RNA polymerase III subunit RPC7